jgi:hypothetical protein
MISRIILCLAMCWVGLNNLLADEPEPVKVHNVQK